MSLPKSFWLAALAAAICAPLWGCASPKVSKRSEFVAEKGSGVFGGGQSSIATAPVPPKTPDPVGPANPLTPVCQQALQMADRGSALAERGMLYSARAELVQALQLMAQALDVQQNTSQHAAALDAGLIAIDEARDFALQAARPGQAVDVSAVASGHRTQLLHAASTGVTSPVIAQQRYFALAQEQLTMAAGGLPAASQALFRLGRLETAMAAHDADGFALHAPRAIVFHQSALSTSPANYLAANELGVLLTRYGQLAEARRLLIHSVSVHPHLEGWHNLAVVHQRLGEADLANRAEHERQQLAAKSGNSPATANNSMVNWVEPKTFAAVSASDTPTDRDAAVRPAAATSGTQRR